MPTDPNPKSVIFLRRSDAPIHVIDGVPVVWEQIGYRTYFSVATDPKVIEGIRERYVKKNVGGVSEVTEKELEEQKKTAEQRTNPVHLPPVMHRDLSHEDPPQTGKPSGTTPAAGAAAADTEKHSASSEQVEDKPKTVKAGELKPAPKKTGRDAP